MTRQKQTPAPPRRQAEGEQGSQIPRKSVSRGRHFVTHGSNLTHVETLREQIRRDAAAYRAKHFRGSQEALDGSAGASTGCPQGQNERSHPRLAEVSSGHPCGHPVDCSATLPEPGSLPCRSLGAIEPKPDEPLPVPVGLNGHYRRSALSLSINVQALIDRHGIDRVAFLTLTFKDHVLDPKEAGRRFHSLSVHVLNHRYPDGWIRVMERQRSGRIHYHLLVVTDSDIRQGVDFDAFAAQDYRTAPLALRLEWSQWRKDAPAYGFGRTELMPIRSNSEAMGAYVGKYIAKGLTHRQQRDKGTRLVGISKGARTATSRLTPLDYGATQWRAKCLAFYQFLRQSLPLGHPRRPLSPEDMGRVLGNRWAYQWRDFICSLPPADPNAVPF